MSPLPASDGDDFPGPVDKLVPGLATEVDDLVVGCDDPVGKPVVAQELPDVLVMSRIFRTLALVLVADPVRQSSCAA